MIRCVRTCRRRKSKKAALAIITVVRDRLQAANAELRKQLIHKARGGYSNLGADPIVDAEDLEADQDADA